MCQCDRILLAPVLSLAAAESHSALQARSWSTFWLMQPGGQTSPCAFRLPSFPVTGLLHESHTLHIQQRAMHRTHTGFPNLPHLPQAAVIVGDTTQLMELQQMRSASHSLIDYSTAIEKVNSNFAGSARNRSLRLGQHQHTEGGQKLRIPGEGEPTTRGQLCHIDAVGGHAAKAQLRILTGLSARPAAGVAE